MVQRRPSKFPVMPPWTPARPLAAIRPLGPRRASTSPSITPKKPARKSPTSSSTCKWHGPTPCCELPLLTRLLPETATPSPQRWGQLRKGRAVFRREDRVDRFAVAYTTDCSAVKETVGELSYP